MTTGKFIDTNKEMVSQTWYYTIGFLVLVFGVFNKDIINFYIPTF